MLHQIFLRIAVTFIFILVVWFLMKHPKGRKLTINAECAQDFFTLRKRILAAQSQSDLTDLEGHVDDFYNLYACKAVNGINLANQLYSLIVEVRMNNG